MSAAKQPLVAVSRGDGETHLEPCRIAPATKDILCGHLGENSSGCTQSESVFDLTEFCHANDDWEPHANTPDTKSYDVVHSGTSPEGPAPHPPERTFLDNDVLLRSVEKYDEVSSLGFNQQARVAQQPYKPPPMAHFATHEHSSHMHTSPYYSKHTSEPVPASSSRYAPYKAQFSSSESASKHRKEATRFDRRPYRPPDTDRTISEVEKDRLYHVERLYNAMTCGDMARDNKGSIAMKRWVHAAYYDSDLVEAYAHKVLDCLLLQAKEGFRGWVSIISLHIASRD